MNRWLFALVLFSLVGCASAQRHEPVTTAAPAKALLAPEPDVTTALVAAVEPLHNHEVVEPIEVPVVTEESLVIQSPREMTTNQLQQQIDALLAQIESMGGERSLLEGDISEPQAQISRLLRQIAEQQDEGWEQYLVQWEDTVSQLLIEWGIEPSAEMLEKIVRKNGLENAHRIFAGQNIWLPAREKPGMVVEIPSSTGEVVADESAEAPSIGEMLVKSFPPRRISPLTAEERYKQAQEDADLVPSPSPATRGHRSSWTDGTREARQASVIVPYVSEGFSLPRPDFFGGKGPYPRTLEELERRITELEDSDRRRWQVIYEQGLRIAELERQQQAPFSFGLFVGTIKRWYASIGEDWRLWEWFVLGGVLVLVISLGTVFFVQWYLDRQNAGPDPDKTVLMDRRGFFRKILDGVRGWRSNRIAIQESARLTEEAALDRAQIAASRKDNVRSIRSKSNTG